MVSLLRVMTMSEKDAQEDMCMRILNADSPLDLLEVACRIFICTIPHDPDMALDMLKGYYDKTEEWRKEMKDCGVRKRAQP